MYERLKQLVFPLLKVQEAHPEPLPGHAEDGFVQIVRASPAYLRYRLFYWKLYAVVWAAGVLILSVILLALGPWYVLLIIPLLALSAFKVAVFYVTTKLGYEMRWYVLTDRSLLIRQGVWVVQEICLTFANAQNVRVKQGPLQRWFGFSNVEVNTAGGGNKPDEQGTGAHRAVLVGLSNPGPVRDLILDLLKRHRSAGLGDPDDHLDHRAPSSNLNPILLNEIWTEARKLRSALAAAPGHVTE